ncbi:MAG: helix-turn-helix domain-containing protein [Gammaproteobacteria bacterium]|nr:helix-turn-helix domain-containing protein [Gammaproteobacteria bacterium]MYG11578.1 helix-turn-helix domain-containing protein [Gammaproteobacteria bacterium]MYK29424.1 helix-turn-helix domain-containing protein [Gammaproteobacteria bacterium]
MELERIDPHRLIQVRKARGLSRRQLAKSSHVSLRQMARIEAKEEPIKVRANTMDRLADTLDVERAVLAGGANLPANLNVPESQPAKIVPEVLVKLRKRRGWSRRELAEKARVSSQLIERIESQAEPVTVQPRSLGRLARAFGPEVEESVLTGEIELKPAAPTPEQWTVTMRSTPGLRLAYELVERRYGAAPKDLFVLAPAIFVLLAEGSLDWRRQKLDRAREANRALDELGGDNPTLYFAQKCYQQAFDRGMEIEEDSIEDGDVLGRDVWNEQSMQMWGFTEDDMTVTPFADYLEELAKLVGKPELVNFDDMLLVDQGVDVWGANPYEVCREDLDEIAGDSALARWALEWGAVRISEIPEHLTSNERTEWLEARASEHAKSAIPPRGQPDDGLSLMLDQLMVDHESE